MIEQLVSEIFTRIGHTWNLAGGTATVPSENDVEKALDEAARMLYNESIGERLEVGGLIIEKRPKGHDVYIFVGNYQ